MTALTTLGLSYNDPRTEQALQLLNNMNNMSVLGALSNLNSTLSPPQQPQLPSNRLKLTVTNPPSQKLAGNSNSNINPMDNLLPPSLASHMTQETSPWKNMFSSLASNGVSSPVSIASNSLPMSTSGGHIGGKFKTLNQSIRQIPNPSLLTNKQNSDPNTMAIQRVLANQVAAAAAANALK